MRAVLLFVLATSPLIACSDNEPLGCSSNANCDGGYVCRDRACLKLCIDDAECSAGSICLGEVCGEGERPAPTITRLVGNSTLSCPGAAENLCFEDGLIIEGTNFTGQLAFALSSPGVELTLEHTLVDSGRADLLLPASLVPGDYTLSVTNSAGTAQAGVTVLQGLPGPDADGNEILRRLNDNATTGALAAARLPAANALIAHLNGGDGSVKLSASLLPAGGGGAMTGSDIVTAANDAATSGRFVVARLPTGDDLIAHLNGTGTGAVKLSASLLPAGGGGGAMTGSDIITEINAAPTVGRIAEEHLAPVRYHLQLGAATAGTASPVDDNQLLGLCGDADGCDISIGLSYWTVYSVSRATLYGQPCRFHIDRTTREWIVAPWCSTRFEASNCVTPGCSTNGTDQNGTGTYGFRQYQSGQQGIDGQTTDGATQNGEWTVLNYYGACVLSEYDVGASARQADNDVGFHFWMQTTTTNAQLDATWNGRVERTCDLVIED